VTLDGKQQEWPVLDLVDDGAVHEVVVRPAERGVAGAKRGRKSRKGER
jgi:hypothetical protein